MWKEEWTRPEFFSIQLTHTQKYLIFLATKFNKLSKKYINLLKIRYVVVLTTQWRFQILLPTYYKIVLNCKPLPSSLFICKLSALGFLKCYNNSVGNTGVKNNERMGLDDKMQEYWPLCQFLAFLAKLCEFSSTQMSSKRSLRSSAAETLGDGDQVCKS